MKAARGRREDRPHNTQAYVSLNAEGLRDFCQEKLGVNVEGKIWACECGCAHRGRGNQQLLAFGVRDDRRVVMVSSTQPGTPDNFTFTYYTASDGAGIFDALVAATRDGFFGSSRASDALRFAKQVLGTEFWGEWP